MTQPRTNDQPAPTLRSSLQQPLLRLQSAIRRYVVFESITFLVVACLVWAAIWLLFDWGVMFKVFGFDYLREGSTAIQRILSVGAVLILLSISVWIITRFLLARIMKPITYSDLALAIERRFGEKLGDRLVTAVELNNWNQAREQGYSPSMIEATTAEAEKQLAKLEVGDVLNTDRLRKRIWVAAAGLLVTLAGILFLPEIVVTWFERNVMFQKVPWPRSTVMELADFSDRSRAVPFGSELKVTIRSAKWAVSDRGVSEGWRSLMLSDLTGKQNVAWELAELPQAAELLEVMPAAWKNRSCDQLEIYFNEPGQGSQREMGLALIRKLQDFFWEHRQENKPLPVNLAAYLPEKLRQMPVEQQKVALAAAAGLSSIDAERILSGLTTLRPMMGDVCLSLGNLSMFPLPNPMPAFSVFQKIAYDRDRDSAPFAMPESERALLPTSWQTMPIRDLAKRLKSYAADESAESLGKLVAQQGQSFIKELEERSVRTQFAKRKSFRKLEVPEKITLEFENLVDTDDRAKGRAKRGAPEVKRTPSTNEFNYEFKKMERAMRLRASVSDIVTPWYRVDVKPLPALKRLVRWQEEPAYLYGSSERVKVGPLVMPLDGEESRASVPMGTSITIEGESHKPLKSVRVLMENSVEAPLVEFTPGQSTFTIKPKTQLQDDLRFKFEFEDVDGIQANRTIQFILIPDKPPEFLKAQFEGLNRKFITAKALLPLSVSVRDDVGMLSLEYEVSVQKNDRSVAYEVRIPFRGYSPLRLYETQPGGMRFDNPEDMTLARVFAQIPTNLTGDPLYLLSTVARLPGGWLGAIPLVQASLRRDFTQDYVDRQLYGPVLNYSDEFLDTLLLRTALNKPMGDPLLETPYRMVVKLVAKDNRMRDTVASHQEGKANEAFEFNVVSEQDVLIEGSKREEDLRDRFEESIAEMRKVRSSLKRIRDELDLPTAAKDDDVRRSMNDAQDATKALALIRGSLDEKVLREFRQIYREFALNRVDEKILNRIDLRICNPLAILLQPEQTFAKLEGNVDILARRLESEGSSLPKNLLNEPVTQADRVIQKLEEILNDMRKLIEFNEALRVLRDLINNEQKLVDGMKKLIEQKLKNDLDDK